MTPHEAATAAWNTYLMDTYVNRSGERKKTYASKWRAFNPKSHQAILAYKNGTGPRPTINDGYGPIIVLVIDLWLATKPAPPWEPPNDVAPRTHNGTDRADARFCTDGLPVQQSSGMRYDRYTRFDSAGRDYDGGRTKDTQVPGLKGADSMDGMEPCDGYTHEGVTYPPWPKESYDR